MAEDSYLWLARTDPYSQRRVWIEFKPVLALRSENPFFGMLADLLSRHLCTVPKNHTRKSTSSCVGRVCAQRLHGADGRKTESRRPSPLADLLGEPRVRYACHIDRKKGHRAGGAGITFAPP